MIKAYACPICGRLVNFETDRPGCGPCDARYGPALTKAVSDPFFYALRTTTGEIFEFESASIRGDVVTLDNIREWHQPGVRGRPAGMCLERGVDIPLAHIVWVADAPHGA